MRENGLRSMGWVAVLLMLSACAAAKSDTVRTIEKRTSKKAIPFSVSYEFSRTVGPRRMVTKQKGTDGALITSYQVTLINGKPVEKKAIRTERVEPKSEIILIGKPASVTSRGGYVRKKVMQMSATGYDISPQTLPGSSGRTCTGIPARFGVIAVDPRVIPLGTKLYIEGYGFGIAADTGGAIKGSRIDLCFNSRSESLAWGRRTVKVHVLGE